VEGGVNDTPDRWWAMSMTPLTKIDTADLGTSKFSILWLLLKGIPIKKSYIGKLYYTVFTTFIHSASPTHHLFPPTMTKMMTPPPLGEG
jgi:hypothetical protein